MCGNSSINKLLEGVENSVRLPKISWHQGNPFRSMDEFLKFSAILSDPLELGGNLGVKDYAGNAFAKLAGRETLDEINEKKEQAEADRKAGYLAATLRGPDAPEKSAIELYDANEVRNRRRRAALMGVSQLRTPSGPGTSSGGAAGGVGSAMY